MISITHLRDAVYPIEFDCLISAEPQHRVGDLSAALLSLRGGLAGLAGLAGMGARADPAPPAPLAAGRRDRPVSCCTARNSIPRRRWRPAAFARAPGSASAGRRPSVQAPRAPGGLGGPGGPGGPWDAGPGDMISLRADPANPFGWLVNKPFRTVPALPAPIVVDAAGGVESPRGRSSWLSLSIAPAASLAIGAIVGWRLHQWLFLLLGLAGVARAGAAAGQQAHGRRARAPGETRVAGRRGHRQARLGAAIAAEEQARRQALPDPASAGRIASGPGTRLWERSPQDQDFLRLRAGTGDLLASTVSLRGGSPGGPYDPAGDPAPAVRDVPVAVPLADLGVLGIAGRRQRAAPRSPGR